MIPFASLLSGMVLSTSESTTNVPLDFVLVGNGGVIVAAATWWLDPYGWDGKVVFVAGTPQPCLSGWQLKRDDAVSIVVASPDPDDLSDLANLRTEMDTDRARYLLKLDQLKEWLGPEWESQIAEWGKAVAARPLRDLVAEHAKAQTANRPVGLLDLVDESGAVVDVMAIDDLGNAATATGDDWLESIAGQWVSFANEDRPTIAQFIAWAASQRTSGPTSVKGGRTINTDGTVEGIALAALQRTV